MNITVQVGDTVTVRLRSEDIVATKRDDARRTLKVFMRSGAEFEFDTKQDIKFFESHIWGESVDV